MGRAKRLSPISLGLASILLVGARGTAAQEDFDRTPVDCVVTTSIDRTQAVDDRTILFFMRGKRVYRNDLPRKCPELQRQNRIMYKTRGNRLCDVDTITVLQQWGARLEPGFTCGLGKFVPITQEEVDDLVRKDIPRDGVESKAVQLPPAEGNAGNGNGNADAAPAPDSPPAEDAPK